MVINLRYDGMTMLVAQPEGKRVLEILETTWLAAKKSDYLIAECRKFLNEHQVDLSSAASVHWSLSFSKFTLIPDVLFEQGKGDHLLQFTTRLDEDEHSYSDFWGHRDIVGIYALPDPLIHWIRGIFEKSTISHSGYSLNALCNLQAHKENFCYLHVGTSFAELLLIQEGKVIFYNQFPFDVKEDLLYYILFALEQNRIIAPELELKTGGKIDKGDELHRLLSTYIGKLSDIGIPAGIGSANHISPSQLRKAANLIAIL